MKQIRALVCAVVCLFALPLFAAQTSIVKPKPAAKPEKSYAPAKLPHKIEPSRGVLPAREWTVLYYMDADNNLEPFMLDDMDEMERIGSTDHVNLVALVDRNPGYEPRDGNWTNNKLFYVTRDSNDQQITSKVVEDFQELDMADPQTLARFVAFGISNFPAKHYALVLGDHGGTWMSSLNDETNNEGGLKLPGLISALEALKTSGAPRLDLMLFDMCLMSQLEVMDAIAPYAAYAVASEELEPGFGQPNHRILFNLTKNPQMGPRDLAQVIVKEFNDACKEAGDNTVTLAAIDLSRIAGVTTAIDNLAAALIKAPAAVLTAVGRARVGAQHFPGNTEDELNSYDIGDFAAILSRQPEAAPLKPQLDAVTAAVKSAVVSHGEGAAHQGATGLAIYFPFNHNVAAAYKSVPLSRTQWDEFLMSEGGQAAAATAGVAITTPDPSSAQKMGTGFPVTAKISGTPSTVHASIAYVGQQSEVSLVFDEEVLKDGAVPVWKDGDTFTYTVRPEVVAVTDGKKSVITPLFAMSPGNRYSQAYASYNSKLGDQKVSVVFDMKTGRMESIFCYSEGGKSAPMAVHPVKGEDLVFYQVTYTGENKEPRFRATTALSPAADAAGSPAGAGKAADKVSRPTLGVKSTQLPKGNYVFVLTAYGPDGAPSGYATVPFTAEGTNVASGVTYPDYGYSSVSQDDLDYVDLEQVIGEEDYNQFDAGWDEYDYTESIEADDYDAEDLSYLDDQEVEEEELSFDDDQLYDYDQDESLAPDQNDDDDQGDVQDDDDSGQDDQGDVQDDDDSGQDDQGDVQDDDDDSGQDDQDQQIEEDSGDQDEGTVDDDVKDDQQDQGDDDDDDDDDSGRLSFFMASHQTYAAVADYVNRAIAQQVA